MYNGANMLVTDLRALGNRAAASRRRNFRDMYKGVVFIEGEEKRRWYKGGRCRETEVAVVLRDRRPRRKWQAMDPGALAAAHSLPDVHKRFSSRGAYAWGADIRSAGAKGRRVAAAQC